MEYNDNPRDKTELMERIHRSWAALEQTLSRLSAAQMTTQEPRGGWSVKDHLAHLSAWEQMLAEIIGGRSGNAVVGMEEKSFLEKNLDELNTIIHQRNKDRTLEDVMRAFKESHRSILTALEKLNDADLARPAFADDPTPRSLLDKIIGDTYGHYDEHRGWIRELLKEIKKA